MKFDPPLLTGKLHRRYKRFCADVELQSGERVTAHCANTGSMKNCLVEGGICWLSKSDNPKRKLAYTLEAVSALHGGMAGINTARANWLVEEALVDGRIVEFCTLEQVQREVRYGERNSRLDFLVREAADTSCDDQGPETLCYLEVKNLTMGCPGGLGMFPDAVTTRGTRHLGELISARSQGHRAMLLFCVQHSSVEQVQVAEDIDPEYARTLRQALAQGIEVVCYSVQMSRQAFVIDRQLPFILD